jgi:hypothetical protein
VPAGETPQFCLSVADSYPYASRKTLYTCMKAATPQKFAMIDESVGVCIDYYSLNPNLRQTVLFIDFGYAKLSVYLAKFS